MAKAKNIKLVGLVGMLATASKTRLNVDPESGLTKAYQLANISLRHLPNIRPRKIWEIIYKKTSAFTNQFPIWKA